ncbi:MAG: ABC transporter permease [Acidobacteria bacterium]|nr:ABC transporter permease [Acidobacteriota bacterium]
MAATDITQITPAGSRLRLGVAEIWRARELLYFLTLRDIKIRYKQTAIGIAWAVLQPVLTTLIFTAIFSGWARFDTNDIAYPLFAMTGLTLWLFVQNAVSMASNSFVNNTNLVTKVYFPRLIVPLAATFAALFDLVLSIVVLAALMAYYKAMPGVALLAVPAFLALAVILAAAVGTLLSALNVRFRDVKFAVPFFLQVWMIASPVFYPASMIPEKWRLIFAINPMTGILEGFRSAVFGKAFDWPLIGVSAASLLVIAAVSLIVFRSMEDDFADVI